MDEIEELLRVAAALWMKLGLPRAVGNTVDNPFLSAAQRAWCDVRDAPRS